MATNPFTEDYQTKFWQTPNFGRYTSPTSLTNRVATERAQASGMNNNFSDFLSPEWSGEIGRTFLEQNPMATYLSSPTGQAFTRGGITRQETPSVGGAMQGQSPARRRFFQESFQDVYNDYLANLGSTARAGDMPSKTFRDYLSEDPFAERYSRLTPDESRYYGSQSRRTFAPSTRQIYY